MSFQFAIQNKSIQPRIKAVLGAVAGILALFLALGIGGQIYISKQESLENRKAFEDNVRFWLGDNGVIFSCMLFLLIVVLIIGIVVFIKHAPYWQQEIHTYGGKIHTTVDDTAAKLSKLSESANTLMKTLPETIIEAAAVVAQGSKGL